MSAPVITALSWEDLPGLFPNFSAPERWLPLLRAHARLIEAASPRVRTSAVTPADAVRRHYAESLEILAVTGEPAGRWVDVGSGGGWPGMVAAILWSGVDVDLIEPLKKRAVLLGEMAETLGLRNVTVYPERAEDAARGPLRESAAIVSARAVAELRELLEYTVPFARRRGGLVVLPKGSSFAVEAEAAVTATRLLGCRFQRVVPMRVEVSEHVRIAVYERSGPLPRAYPRRPGTPGLHPL